MKSNILKNSISVLAALFIFSAISCDSDDDLPVLPAVVVNTFCYGLEEGDSFETENGYYDNLEEIGPRIYRTSAFLTEANITVDVNGELQGAGALIELKLYGNLDDIFQSGTYIIQNGEEVGNAFVSYLIDFDSTSAINRGIILQSGAVRVSPYQSGYIIEIDGENIDGDRFHGIYLGNILPL